MPSPMGAGLLEMADEQPKPSWFSNIGPQVSYGGGGSPMGGGGDSGFSVPPELAQYFSQYGGPRLDDPRTVAQQSGVSLGQLANGLLPRGQAGQYAYEPPNDQGGFFSIKDLFGLSGTPTKAAGGGSPVSPGGPQSQVIRQGAIGVPQLMEMGQEQPSTNNWRLLGQGPGWIMRNGQLINTNDPAVRFGFYAGGDTGPAAEGGSYAHRQIALGTGTPFGSPSYYGGGSMAGWPGGVGWHSTRFPYGTDV